MTSVRIRPFLPGDLEQTVLVWERAKRDAYPWLGSERGYGHDDNLHYFRDEICRRCAVWVATAGGRVVGLLALAGRFIDQLYVDPQVQGTGVGGALLDHAKALSPGGLTLSTFQRNGRARSFYERRGFVITGTGVSPPPENEPDVRYAWRRG